MTTSMKQDSYSSIVKRLATVAERSAERRMNRASEEVKPDENEIEDVKCMFDGTWQKRGFSSLVGAVTCTVFIRV